MIFILFMYITDVRNHIRTFDYLNLNTSKKYTAFKSCECKKYTENFKEINFKYFYWRKKNILIFIYFSSIIIYILLFPIFIFFSTSTKKSRGTCDGTTEQQVQLLQATSFYFQPYRFNNHINNFFVKCFCFFPLFSKFLTCHLPKSSSSLESLPGMQVSLFFFFFDTFLSLSE